MKILSESGSEDTREALLDAAASIIRNMGMGKLTLESAAREAGVSKGGLLYHFPSRDALLEGLLSRGLEEFDQAVKDRVAKGAGWLEAYVQAALAPGELDDLGPGLLAAITENPALLEPARAKYRQWYLQALADAGSDGVLVLLILDGIFMHQTLGFNDILPPVDLVKKIQELSGRPREAQT